MAGRPAAAPPGCCSACCRTCVLPSGLSHVVTHLPDDDASAWPSWSCALGFDSKAAPGRDFLTTMDRNARTTRLPRLPLPLSLSLPMLACSSSRRVAAWVIARLRLLSGTAAAAHTQGALAAVRACSARGAEGDVWQNGLELKCRVVCCGQRRPILASLPRCVNRGAIPSTDMLWSGQEQHICLSHYWLQPSSCLYVGYIF